VALEDDVLGGCAIPAGSTIYVSLYAVHRRPDLWPDPERFDPDRFEADRIASRARFAYIPYAAGHRNCIGALMAAAELKVVVATIAQRYVLDLAPGHRVEPAAGTTMHPRFGMRMVVRRTPGHTAVSADAADSRAAERAT
jgi:cytochrome P450